MRNICIALLVTLSLSLSKLVVAENGLPPLYAVEAVKPTHSRTLQWWLPRHQDKIAQAKKQQVDLLMLGDSITHGWEGQGANVWRQYYQHRNAFNLGFAADRTEHVLWRLENGELDNISPKLTVLMIGTNNTGYRMDPAAHTAKGIEAIVKMLNTRLPQSKVLLLAIFPRHYSANNLMRKHNQAINTYIAAMADNKKIFYLNINHVFVDLQGNLDTQLMPDLLHPNEQGYQAWAQAMEPTIERLMQ